MTAQFATVHTASDSQDQGISSVSENTNGDIPQQISCLCYIGLPDNPQFLGPQDPQALAEHIMISRGPSGENRDYLWQLEEALNGLSEESGDEHISDLAQRCRDIAARDGLKV